VATVLRARTEPYRTGRVLNIQPNGIESNDVDRSDIERIDIGGRS
jgi:hypothetical protein